jgi:hypothetical protein
LPEVHRQVAERKGWLVILAVQCAVHGLMQAKHGRCMMCLLGEELERRAKTPPPYDPPLDETEKALLLQYVPYDVRRAADVRMPKSEKAPEPDKGEPTGATRGCANCATNGYCDHALCDCGCHEDVMSDPTTPPIPDNSKPADVSDGDVPSDSALRGAYYEGAPQSIDEHYPTGLRAVARLAVQRERERAAKERELAQTEAEMEAALAYNAGRSASAARIAELEAEVARLTKGLDEISAELTKVMKELEEKR